MLSKKMEKVLNEQINAEYHSSYIYLSMSAYFQKVGLSGFANWMRVQSKEELTHVDKFFDYIIERGGEVKLTPIAEVDVDFDGVVDVYEKTLAHEQYISGRINDLMDVAIEERDHASRSMLQWFVDEQVEEEANVKAILDNLRLINGQGNGLFMMDREMQTRVFVDPAKIA